MYLRFLDSQILTQQDILTLFLCLFTYTMTSESSILYLNYRSQIIQMILKT